MSVYETLFKTAHYRPLPRSFPFSRIGWKMNLARIASTVLKARIDPSWHPGSPPERPKKPGKRAGVIPWMLWRYEKRKWRNHDKKDSPWWDWYRSHLNGEYWMLVRA